MINNKIFKKLSKLEAKHIEMLCKIKLDQVTYNNGLHKVGKVSFYLTESGKRQNILNKLYKKELIEDVNGKVTLVPDVRMVVRYMNISKIHELLEKGSNNLALSLWGASVKVIKNNFRNAL